QARYNGAADIYRDYGPRPVNHDGHDVIHSENTDGLPGDKPLFRHLRDRYVEIASRQTSEQDEQRCIGTKSEHGIGVVEDPYLDQHHNKEKDARQEEKERQCKREVMRLAWRHFCDLGNSRGELLGPGPGERSGHVLPVSQRIPLMIAAVERSIACQTKLRSIPSCAPKSGKMKTNPITIIRPYGSSRANGSASTSGRIPTAMRPPSRGGIGTRLKTASRTLMRIAFLRL